MNARFDGMWLWLPKEAGQFYEQSGYGRPAEEGLRLAPEEGLYLVSRGKIQIEGETFDTFFSRWAIEPEKLRKYIVYKDLRERGYAVQTGPHDFRVFRRGQKPGSGESQYFVRVLSERSRIIFSDLILEVTTTSNMRKQHILAAVDDESEITYYEVKLPVLPEIQSTHESIKLNSTVTGCSAIVKTPDNESLEKSFYGTRFDELRLLLSPNEALFLAENDELSLTRNDQKLSLGEYSNAVISQDDEMKEKSILYSYLRTNGYIPRTGYKFGHHFRVYSGKKTHSEMLIHAVGEIADLPMSTISRSVRLAHSVKKKMLFGCVNTRGVSFVEFARIKL